MTTPKANCLLLNVKGKYYYAEEFGKFIELVEWEYEQILNNPYLYYFSTALKKHGAASDQHQTGSRTHVIYCVA